MRIGLSGGASSVEKMIAQAVAAEAEGFTSLWYASAIGGDPLVAMALAGRATQTLELGCAVLQTYSCHPVLQANRAASVVGAMGRSGFTLGLGPSHRPVIESMYGLSYAHPGRHTEEYVAVVTALLRGEGVDLDGAEFRVHVGPGTVRPEFAVPVLVSALAPRMLRLAGEMTDGTILWMANARSIAAHVAPKLHAAALDIGKPSPRIVAGLPVAVHGDVAEARAAAAEQFGGYGALPNYRRILDIGGGEGPADAAIVGDESGVAAQMADLLEAGATDVWAAIFPVGSDRQGSRERTRALLKELASRD